MNFIILSAGRTGTTLLAKALNEHPDVHMAGEALKPASLEKHDRSYQEQHNIVFAKDRDVKAQGCKLFFHHLNRDSAHWDWYRDNALIIHSMRTDYLAWYVSLMSAHQNGEWNRRRKEQAPPLSERRITVDVEHMQRKIAGYKTKIEWARDWTDPERYMEVDYDDMIGNWAATIGRVEDALGIDRRPLPQRCVKLNPEPLSERVTNWKDVKETRL